jgi:hypothetical protein
MSGNFFAMRGSGGDITLLSSGGEWRNLFLCSILRKEWKEPKILAMTT